MFGLYFKYLDKNSVPADILKPKMSPFCAASLHRSKALMGSVSILDIQSNDYNLNKKKYMINDLPSSHPVACKHVFLRFPVCMCGFCGSEAARCISLLDRVR